MPHHLLIADDSVTIQRVIKLTFADEDVEVVAVSDGSQAVAIIDKDPPDIVLADVEMPGCSGYDVARHVRNSPHLSHIPVVLLIGAFEPIDAAKASAVGCDGVLAKPFEPQAVLTRVRELLSKPRASTGAVPVPPVVPAPPHALSAPVASIAPVTADEAPKPPQDLDAYFQRLDQAFADLATSPRWSPSSPVPLEFATETSESNLTFRSPAPLSFSTGLVAKDREAGGDVAVSSSPAVIPSAVDVVPETPAIRSSRPGVQSLVEAFQGLIAEERAGPADGQPADAAAPASGRAAAPPALVAPGSTTLSDEAVDEIAARVMDRLAGTLAGGDIKDLVSRIAERLVRAEIDQIKRHLDAESR